MEFYWKNKSYIIFQYVDDGNSYATIVAKRENDVLQHIDEGELPDAVQEAALRYYERRGFGGLTLNEYLVKLGFS